MNLIDKENLIFVDKGIILPKFFSFKYFKDWQFTNELTEYRQGNLILDALLADPKYWSEWDVDLADYTWYELSNLLLTQNIPFDDFIRKYYDQAELELAKIMLYEHKIKEKDELPF